MIVCGRVEGMLQEANRDVFQVYCRDLGNQL
jgi:hypothetical protein